MKVLLEMRPALDGHAGIPQETRLLFRALNLLDDVVAEGLIQSSGQVLAKGLHGDARGQANKLSADQKIDRLSRMVVSLQRHPNPTRMGRLGGSLALGLAPTAMMLRHLLGMEQPLGFFDATHFRDFVWRSLFAKTLPFEDFDAVTRAGYRVAHVPWTAMHICGLLTRKLGRALYPRLDTRDFDVMIAETPYPASVSRHTRLVVRYHDAIPVLMPHTISNKSFHQASHYHALRHNVASGAYFACVSEATRHDLVSIFPEAQARSQTIHNMVSHHYFAEDSTPDRVPEILRTRRHDTLHAWADRPAQTGPSGTDTTTQPMQYLLMVSTVEPRKNHLTLLSAWEQLRTEHHPGLKLVIVGMLGWDSEAIVAKFKPWLERGEVFMLHDVPAPELRLLYRHARATICPSFGEGFDFSGVEAMRSGGAVAASDIAVHRDIYADAAQYFSPYSAADAAAAIRQVIDPAEPARRAELVRMGHEVSKRYLPEHVLPQWHRFLHQVVK